MNTLTRYLLARTSARVVFLLIVFLVLVAGGQVGAAVGRGVPIFAILPTLPSIIMLGLPIAIPLALAAGVLVTVSGMHRDGEFRALAASGIRTAEVIAKLWPLLVIAVVATTVLTHMLLPEAMRGLRANQERFMQAALAHRVNDGRPLYREGAAQAFALTASGQRLGHVFMSQKELDTEMALYASGAHWYVASNGDHSGLGLELDDVSVLRREGDGRVSLVHSPSAQFPLGEGSTTHDQLDEPDTWTTPQLISFLAAWDPKSKASKRSDYNNARLSLHLRMFIPFSLVAFALFAAGLGLRRGTSDSLIAVIIVIIIVALSTTPALFYVKNAVDHRLVSPAWLLWPQATVFASLGLWWIAHPDLANDRGSGSQHIRTWLRAIRGRFEILVRKRIGGRDHQSPRLFGTSRLSVLTRLILGQGVSTWIAVLFIGTFLVVLGQVIGRMGVFVRALTRRPREMTEFLVFSLPDFIGMWLPMSVGAAALLVAAPMLRRGNLMVLSASGIPLRRVFAPFLLIALFASVCKFVIDDQLSTRLGPIVSEREEGMYVRDSNPNRREPPAGWRTDTAFLLSGHANLEQGIFESFAAFTGKPGQGTALLAQALRWGGDADPRWHLDRAVEVTTQGQRHDFGETTTDIPPWLGLPSFADVELSLVPDRIKTSNQLLASHAPLGFHIILARIMTAMTPILGLLLALPGFVRFENRNRLGKTLATSCLLLVVPILVVTLANRAILSNQGQPLLTALAVLALLGGVGGWRWAHMRP